MDFLKVLILSIVEGITEFLPISSTGHLIITNEFINLLDKDFTNTFNVIIQLGAILAVVVIYFQKLNPFSKKNLSENYLKKYKDMSMPNKIYNSFLNRNKSIMNLWKKIIVALIPSVILGLLFDDLIDKYLFNPYTVAIMLIVWGIGMILVENVNKNKESIINDFQDLNFISAFKIGCFQTLALVQGTSRSAATILGGLILGCDRLVATEFSFYLAIPTMLGATVLKVIKKLHLFTAYQWLLILIGMFFSFIVAYIAIKKLMQYLKNHDFKVFGYYRIIVGIIVLLYFSLIK